MLCSESVFQRVSMDTALEFRRTAGAAEHKAARPSHTHPEELPAWQCLGGAPILKRCRDAAEWPPSRAVAYTWSHWHVASVKCVSAFVWRSAEKETCMEITPEVLIAPCCVEPSAVGESRQKKGNGNWGRMIARRQHLRVGHHGKVGFNLQERFQNLHQSSWWAEAEKSTVVLSKEQKPKPQTTSPLPG